MPHGPWIAASRLLACVVLVMAAVSARANECTSPLNCTWKGGVGSWEDPSMWSGCGDGDCVPGAEDTALINSGIVQFDNISVGTLVLNGGLVTGSELTIMESFVWTGGSMEGPGATVISPLAVGVIESAGTVRLLSEPNAPSQRELHNFGFLQFVSGQISSSSSENKIQNHGVMQINSPGTTIPTSDTVIFSGQLINHPGALITRSALGLAGISTVNFQNQGEVWLFSGELAIRGFNGPSGIDTGAYSLGEDATLTISGVRLLSQGFSIQGEGRLRIAGQGGTTTIENGLQLDIPWLEIVSGNLAATDDTHVLNRFDWSGGAMEGSGSLVIGENAEASINAGGQIRLNGSRNLVNLGQATVQNNTIGRSFGPGGVVRNEGLWSFVQSSGATTGISGGVRFINEPQGLVTVSATNSVQVRGFDNAGSVSVSTGLLNLRTSPSQTTGIYDIGQNAILEFQQHTHTVFEGALFLGDGLVRIRDATLSIDAQASIDIPRIDTVGSLPAIRSNGELFVTERLDWRGGSLSGSGEITIDEDAVMVISGAGAKTFRNSLTFHNLGEMRLTEGRIAFSDTPQVFNAGTFEISTDGQIAVNTFTNLPTGSIVRRGAGETDWRRIFNNQGIFTVEEGVLSLNTSSGTSVDSGLYVVEEDALLDIRGPRQWIGPGAVGRGVVRISSHSLAVAGIAAFPKLELQAGVLNLGSSISTITRGFIRTGGTFNAGNSTVIFASADGPLAPVPLDLSSQTSFHNLTVAVGTLLVEAGEDNLATVNGTLTNNGVIRNTRSLATGTNTFGLTGVDVNAEQTGTLIEVTIDRVGASHPLANASTDTGEHWLITAPGLGFAGSVSLPHTLADPQAATVCRLTPQNEWDCDRQGATATTVTRASLTELAGAWAVGDEPVCKADINGDGVVDADDFFEFLSLFAAGDLRADFNNDGVIDADDFFLYLSLFAAGC